MNLFLVGNSAKNQNEANGRPIPETGTDFLPCALCVHQSRARGWAVFELSNGVRNTPFLSNAAPASTPDPILIDLMSK